MRRRTQQPALRLELVDWLLEGQVRANDDAERAAGVYDSFIEFDVPGPDLAGLWREHRAALMAEAERRGVREPWGLQFDAEGVCARV